MPHTMITTTHEVPDTACRMSPVQVAITVQYLAMANEGAY